MKKDVPRVHARGAMKTNLETIKWVAVTSAFVIAAVAIAPWAFGTSDSRFLGVFFLALAVIVILAFLRGFRR
jgi:hypothetical protein